MTTVNLQSHVLNGVWIQETYSGSVDSSSARFGGGGSVTLKRDYLLRKKGDGLNPEKRSTQEMHQTEAYAALQSFILNHQYLLTYVTNEDTVKMWAARISVKTDKQIYPTYKGEVMWEFDPRKPNYILGQTTWSHRMVSGLRNTVYPLSQEYYVKPGFPTIPYYGVNWIAKDRTYEGVECYAPEWRMTAKRQWLASYFDTECLIWLHSMSRCVNETEFRGFAPGCVLFLGVDVDEAPVVYGQNQVVDVTYHFIVEPALPEGFMYDGIELTFGKKGHAYLWAVSHLGENELPITNQVNIAQMYKNADLNSLGLTSGQTDEPIEL